MKPTDPADLPRDDSGAVEQAEQPQAGAVEPPTEAALSHPEQPTPSKAPSAEEMLARMMAGLPGRFVPGPGETAPAEQGPQSVWHGLESAQELVKLLFLEPGDVVEVRALKKRKGYGKVSSGYFTSPLEFMRAAARLDGEYGGLYATLNRVNPDLLARASNRIEDRAEHTTTDSDITERRLFLIDIDPIRPAGVSSNEEEHAHALEVAGAIAAELTELGWPAPVLADSGNGAHLIYRLSSDSDDEDLLKACLGTLAMQFDSNRSTVDRSVTKRAQLTKLYGSMACKGDSIAERPHRRSAILSVPDAIVPVSREQLEALAARLPIVERHRTPHGAGSGNSGQRSDVAAMLASAGLQVRRFGPWDGKERWVLETCPWNPGHGPGKAWVARFPSGAMAAGCLHSGCAGRNWHDLVPMIYPSSGSSANGANAVASNDVASGAQAVPANVGVAAEQLCPPGEGDREAHSSAASATSSGDAAAARDSAPAMRRPGEYRVGDLVSPADRDNLGEVFRVDAQGVWVLFVNPETGRPAERCFVPAALKLVRAVVESTQIRVLSTQDVLKFVPSPWLIQDVLKQFELAVIYGAPGAGKSMVALDMALCIAHGRPWNGHETAPGPVLYIVAEGQGGLKQRLLAWNDGKLPDLDAEGWKNFHVIAEPVQLVGDDLAILIKEADAKVAGLKLVIVDTLARTALGLEENSAKDMGKYVHAADELRKRVKAAVLLVHHATKPRDDAPGGIRGSSAITGAVETEIAVAKAEDDHVTVICGKQKDAAEFTPMLLVKRSVDLAEVLQTPGANGGRVVFVKEIPEAKQKQAKRGRPGRASGRETDQKILDAFESAFRGKWVSTSNLLPASGVPKSTFYKALQRLVDAQLVEEQMTGSRYEYRPKDRSLSSPSPAVSPSPSGSAAPQDPPVSRLSSPVGGETERRDRGMGEVSVQREVER